jgi:pimeloyl-ACP methyl ester carboxylesterase
MTTTAFVHSVGGIDWYCEMYGDGPVVVLVPSGEGDCASFARVTTMLADRFTVLTFDMPGFSRTTAPAEPDDFTPLNAVDQIASLVRSLDIGRATFYGCSSGGVMVLGLIATQPDLVISGIVHEVAIDADYRFGTSRSLLAGLAALSDAEIIDRCRMIYRDLMNEDAAAWNALGPDYHARLARNYVTWVRHYVDYRGPLPAWGPADLTQRPIAWTIGGLTPAMTFFSNVQLTAGLGIDLGLLPCKHFPQVSIPEVLADHISRNAARHLP